MPNTEKLDPTTGTEWLRQFTAETHVDVATCVVKPWGCNIRFEELTDRETAEALAAFLRARYPVTAYVYPPLGHGYEVPVMRQS